MISSKPRRQKDRPKNDGENMSESESVQNSDAFWKISRDLVSESNLKWPKIMFSMLFCQYSEIISFENSTSV